MHSIMPRQEGGGQKKQMDSKLTKKMDIICNRCGKVVCEIHGSDWFPYEFEKIRTIEKHWPTDDWFAEVVCLECAGIKEEA